MMLVYALHRRRVPLRRLRGGVAGAQWAVAGAAMATRAARWSRSTSCSGSSTIAIAVLGR